MSPLPYEPVKHSWTFLNFDLERDGLPRCWDDCPPDQWDCDSLPTDDDGKLWVRLANGQLIVVRPRVRT
jgi:hypothetical protein